MVNCGEGSGVKAVEGEAMAESHRSFHSLLSSPSAPPQVQTALPAPLVLGLRGALRGALPPGWAEGLGPLGPHQGAHLLPAAGTRTT